VSVCLPLFFWRWNVVRKSVVSTGMYRRILTTYDCQIYTFFVSCLNLLLLNFLVIYVRRKSGNKFCGSNSRNIHKSSGMLHSILVIYEWNLNSLDRYTRNKGLFKMIVGVLTNCHTQ
jgi:hypothetical protein